MNGKNNPNLPYSLAGKRVWVAGHRGMVGSAIVRRLSREDCEIQTVDRAMLDLTRQHETEDWIAAHKPHAVFLAAAKVGGILANDTYPAQFIFDNLAITANVIDVARRVGVEKLLFLGSSCIYPKLAPQPIREDTLLTGALEPTNEAYALAKITGLKLAANYRRQYGCDFISAMPTNLYGPNDNFDLETSHVLPALMRKAHDAKMNNDARMTVWGSGTPRREFLHVDDCADAIVFLMKNYSNALHINVGAGKDISIAELAELARTVVGFSGKLVYDTSRPDGTPRKLLDVSRLTTLGWQPRIGLREGIDATYRWFLDNHA